VLLFLVFTLPRSLQERRAAEEAMALREELDSRRTEMAQARTRAQTVKANIAETSRFYREAVPECTGHSTSVVKELDSITRQLSVKLDRISTSSKEVERVPLTELSITAPIVGQYQQVGGFLQRVERSSQFLVVESVQMRERKADGGGAELSVKINAYCHSTAPRKAARR
jgi:Tfp pilus assembly protein PilO